MTPPSIEESTKEERADFIMDKFRCIADCDACGNCIFLHHEAPEIVFDDYINGMQEYREILLKLRDIL